MVYGAVRFDGHGKTNIKVQCHILKSALNVNFPKACYRSGQQFIHSCLFYFFVIFLLHSNIHHNPE